MRLPLKLTPRECVLLAAAALIVVSITRNAAFVRLLLGFVVLFGAGDRTTPTQRRLRLATAVLGGALVASGVGPELRQRWLGPTIVASVIVFSAAVPGIARRTRPGTVWLLALLSIGGIYACVPETGHLLALALLAALLAAVEVHGGQRLGDGALLVAGGVLSWAVAYGGTFRDSAVVGGFASFAVLVAEPLARTMRSVTGAMRRGPEPNLVTIVLIPMHAVAALVVARTAGLAPDLSSALRRAAPTLVVVIVLLVGLDGVGSAGGDRPRGPEHQ